VNVQTSIMIKSKNKAEDEPTTLNWVWRAENVDDSLHGKGNFSTNGLIDQKIVASDTSDYLWYMTR